MGVNKIFSIFLMLVVIAVIIALLSVELTPEGTVTEYIGWRWRRWRRWRPQCNDGKDNDGDGLIDYPKDPGCSHSRDISERNTRVACDDGEDNDGDGKIDMRDPGCSSLKDNDETDGPRIAKPDLKIERISYYLDHTINPTKIHYKVLIKNVGRAPCSFYSNIIIPQLSNHQDNTCTYLKPGDICTETGYGFSLGGKISTGQYDISVFVDNQKTCDESNENNNKAERRFSVSYAIFTSPTVSSIPYL